MPLDNRDLEQDISPTPAPNVAPAPPRPPPKQLRRKKAVLSRRFKRLLEKESSELSALESNILSAAKGSPVRTLFITSSRRREGKTTAALAMAHSLSVGAAGRVVLVDANLSNPTLHECFQVSDSPGLLDYLVSRSELTEIAVDTEYHRLSVIPLGGAVANVAGAFAPQVFKGKLDALASQYEYVVIDGDSILSSSNAAIMAQYFDGVLLVIECEKTKWQVLQLAREKVEGVGGNVLGVVLNKRHHYIPRGLYGKV
jgi:protein-tyrosine kinase